jgi:ABC-type enterochelin transport system ATPase subunit
MIKNGRILASGPTPEVFCSDLLEKLFDFPLKVDQINGHVVVLR